MLTSGRLANLVRYTAFSRGLLARTCLSADKLNRPALLFCWLLISQLLPINTQAADVAYQIKASYLYNFLQFVSFPKEFLADEQKIQLCLLGEDLFGRALDELEGATTPQGTVKIRRLGPYRSSTRLEHCNVLFFSISESATTERILAKVDAHKILTISDFSPFIPYGGLIELYQENDKIRFRINETLVKETLFKVAAQLVQLGVN